MRAATVLAVACVVAAAFAAAPPLAAGPVRLTAEQQKHIDGLTARASAAAFKEDFERAAKLLGQAAEYRAKHQGAKHWETVDAALNAEQWRRLTKVPAEQRQSVVRSCILNEYGVRLHAEGKYSEALPLFRKALEINQKAQGEAQPHTATGYNNVADCLRDLGKAPEALPLYKKALAINQKALGEAHPDTARSYFNVAFCLHKLGEGSEALPLYKTAQAIWVEALGECHPVTARGYGEWASRLQDLGKSSEALPLHKKALAIREKVLGETHPDTAQSYNNVAGCLVSLGKASEALPLHKRALATWEKAGGEGHPDTAKGCNGLAYCLQDLGKASEALPLYRKALDINQKAWGEAHPLTAASYNNLADCLLQLGEASEALPLYKKALEINQKVLGETHPDTALSYNNVAGCLGSQGKMSEALPLHKKALEIWEKAHGEGHPQTAIGYQNVAGCLRSLGKASEALPLYKKALATWKKALGETHPNTAAGCNALAYCLQDLGKASEALPLYKRALAIREKAQGEGHPDTANTCNNLALCLWHLDEHAKAVRLWQQSVSGQEAARFHFQRESGFARAASPALTYSPRAGLAVGLAKLGQPRGAFAQAEASLARGLLDDMAAANGSADVARLRALEPRLKKLDAAIIAFAGVHKPTTDQRTQHEATVREQRAVLDEMAKLIAEDSARRVLPLARIQKAIPDDAAYVLYLDAQERWACVLRGKGDPQWVHLPGSEKKGKLSKDDRTLPSRLHAPLNDPSAKDADRRDLSAAFVKQLFDPLRKHLKGVKRLFVVPTGPFASVPLEALVEDFTVAYVPSGSVLALLAEKRRPLDGKSLLALGDPVFDRSETTPPASGLLIKAVLPNSPAAKADLRPGDVLLEYDGVTLESIDDLKAAIKDRPVVARLWREGTKEKIKLGGGPLGVILDNRSSRAAVRAWRKEQEALDPTTGHARLPGTRYEVEAVAKLVKSSRTLLGSDASEQMLDELQSKGELKQYRLILLATHGEVNWRDPGLSALILAQDKLPSKLEQVRQGKKVYDGRLTVSRIRADAKHGGWDLDADLVVLSACETGLGKDAGGDGLLGFSQAFIHKGARSVLLSRWKVDDVATALLMTRFFENLLGKRDDLKNALGRTAALAEAAKWLRELPRADVEKLAAHLFGGTLRDTRRSLDAKIPKKGKEKPAGLPKGDKPFAHPAYWAAFVLVGDPE